MGKKKWFLPSEVIVHNKVSDIWVVLHGKIFCLTEFLKRYYPPGLGGASCCVTGCTGGDTCICRVQKIIRPLLAFAGKDVSHWFQDGVFSYKTHIHPITWTRDIYAPRGIWPQISGVVPSPKWIPPENPMWFEDQSLIVGCLTKNPRSVKIINTLSGDSITLEVCEEETIYEIMEHRYLPYNRHYPSYTWMYRGRLLDLTATLKENEVLDERDGFVEVGLSEDIYLPSILLYYNDDLTEDFPDPPPPDRRSLSSSQPPRDSTSSSQRSPSLI